jgi:hypothetical protein
MNARSSAACSGRGRPAAADIRQTVSTARSIILWLLTRERSTWSIPTAAREVEAVSGAFFATTHELLARARWIRRGHGHPGDLDSSGGVPRWSERLARADCDRYHIGGTSVRQAPLEIDAFGVGALRLIRKREGRFASAIVRAVLLCRSVAVLVLDALHIHRLARRRNRERAFVSLRSAGAWAEVPLPLEPEQPA